MSAIDGYVVRRMPPFQEKLRPSKRKYELFIPTRALVLGRFYPTEEDGFALDTGRVYIKEDPAEAMRYQEGINHRRLKIVQAVRMEQGTFDDTMTSVRQLLGTRNRESEEQKVARHKVNMLVRPSRVA